MRIEVTLRTTSTPKASNKEIANLSNLNVGDIISGNIRRVVMYGLFISIDQTNSVSNCNLLNFKSYLTCFSKVITQMNSRPYCLTFVSSSVFTMPISIIVMVVVYVHIDLV